MTRQIDPDLFGCGHHQGELFDNQSATTQWKPDADKVRRRLDRILAEARASRSMPWDWSRENLYQTIFPQMAGLLPKEEGAQYCFQFERELERLKAA